MKFISINNFSIHLIGTCMVSSFNEHLSILFVYSLSCSVMNMQFCTLSHVLSTFSSRLSLSLTPRITVLRRSKNHIHRRQVFSSTWQHRIRPLFVVQEKPVLQSTVTVLSLHLCVGSLPRV